MSDDEPRPQESPVGATRLRRFPNRTEAALAQGKLAAEGIDSWLVGGYSAYEEFEGAELLVRPADLEAALEVLGSVKLRLEEQIRRGDRPTCMDCDGENLEFTSAPPSGGFRRAVWNFFHRNRAELRCRDCGYTWLVRL